MHEAHTEITLIGYAIGRQVGNAVMRNRIRRRLRSVFAELDRAGHLMDAMLVVGVRSDRVATMSFEQLQHEVVDLIERTRKGSKNA